MTPGTAPAVSVPRSPGLRQFQWPRSYLLPFCPNSEQRRPPHGGKAEENANPPMGADRSQLYRCGFQVEVENRTATQLRKTQMPAGEPLHLCDLVAYQEGTATSRSLIKHAGGTLTLFAFDVGQGLTEHSAAYHALVQIMEGNAERYHFG